MRAIDGPWGPEKPAPSPVDPEVSEPESTLVKALRNYLAAEKAKVKKLEVLLPRDAKGNVIRVGDRVSLGGDPSDVREVLLVEAAYSVQVSGLNKQHNPKWPASRLEVIKEPAP